MPDEVGEPEALRDVDLERVAALLVDLPRAVLGRGRRVDVAPAVRLQHRPHHEPEARGLQPSAIDKLRRLHGGRLDHDRALRLVGEARRQRDVVELGAEPRRRTRRGQEHQREDRAQWVFHGRSLATPTRRNQEIRVRSMPPGMG